jgi:hypothetical protein
VGKSHRILMEKVIKMKASLITLKNLTLAMKATHVLKNEGVITRVVKLNGHDEYGECKSGLEFDWKEEFRVIEILKKNGIPYSSVRRSNQ